MRGWGRETERQRERETERHECQGSDPEIVQMQGFSRGGVNEGDYREGTREEVEAVALEIRKRKCQDKQRQEELK